MGHRLAPGPLRGLQGSVPSEAIRLPSELRQAQRMLGIPTIGYPGEVAGVGKGGEWVTLGDIRSSVGMSPSEIGGLGSWGFVVVGRHTQEILVNRGVDITGLALAGSQADVGLRRGCGDPGGLQKAS